MEVSQLTYPDGIVQPSEKAVEDFEDLIWTNSEVCNNCFRQVRAVGDLVEKHTDCHTHEVNTYYERTEHGSQEYSPHVPAASERYGQCFCEDCGADTRTNDKDLSIEDMTHRAVNLVRYINHETDEWASGRVMAKTIKELKGEPDNGGYDSEIYCVATMRALNTGAERGDARARQQA